MSEIFKLADGTQVGTGMMLPIPGVRCSSVQFDKGWILEPKSIEQLMKRQDYRLTRERYQKWRINQGSIGSCFTQGHKVTMSDGSIRNIEDIKEGDFVRTHKGNNCLVTQTMTRSFTGRLVTVFVKGWGRLKATDCHPFLVDGAWVKAGDLKVGDQVSLAKNPSQAISTIDLADYVEGSVYEKDGKIKLAGCHRLVERYLPIDELTCRVLGLYAAEGSSDFSDAGTPHRACFTLHKRETALATDVMNFAERLGLETTVVTKEKSKAITVRIASCVLASFFKTVCGRFSNHKKVPRFLLTASREQKLWFVQGYFAGDGNFAYKPKGSDSRNTTTFPKHEVIGMTIEGTCLQMTASTTSRVLAHQVSTLMLDLDYNPGRTSRPANRNQNFRCYIISCYGDEAAELAGLTYTNPGRRKRRLYTSDDSSQMRPIRSIDYEDVENVNVYDFTVQDDHSFICQGVAVHNCNAAAKVGAMYRVADRMGLPHVPLSENDLYIQINGGVDQGSLLSDAFEVGQTVGVAPRKMKSGVYPYQAYRRSQVADEIWQEGLTYRPSFRSHEPIPIPTDSDFAPAIASCIARGWPIIMAWHVGGSSMKLRNGYVVQGRGKGNHASFVHGGKWVGGKDLVHPDLNNSWTSYDSMYGRTGSEWGEGGNGLITMEGLAYCKGYHKFYALTGLVEPA